jgi:hypothetical protein
MKFFKRLLNSCTSAHSPHLIRCPRQPAPPCTRAPVPYLISRYTRIKTMLLNAAAGSAASALNELAFETTLAATHFKVNLPAPMAMMIDDDADHSPAPPANLNPASCSVALSSAGGSTW